VFPADDTLVRESVSVALDKTVMARVAENGGLCLYPSE